MGEVKRWWWVFRCTRLIVRKCEWDRKSARDYAEALYQTYVLEDSADWSPADAVSEDMTYWGD